MSTHYHIGQNTPGYMPEGDAYTTRTKTAAREVLKEDKEHALSSYREMADESGDKVTIVGNAREMWYHITSTAYMYDLGLSLWVNECDEDECEHELEEEF